MQEGEIFRFCGRFNGTANFFQHSKTPSVCGRKGDSLKSSPHTRPIRGRREISEVLARLFPQILNNKTGRVKKELNAAVREGEIFRFCGRLNETANFFQHSKTPSPIRGRREISEVLARLFPRQNLVNHPGIEPGTP